MGISNRKQRDSFNEINITPLTDIFLVLLVIMMIIAPLLDQQGLKLLVPSEQEVENPKESKILTIDVTDKGEYLMDGNVISANNLLFTIRDAAKEKKDGLLIQANNEATHGAIVSLMDAARNAGVTNITVIEK